MLLAFTDLTDVHVVVLEGSPLQDLLLRGLGVAGGVYVFPAGAALDHLPLGGVSVGSATAGAGQAFVSLLVAGVAHRVVVVPPAALTRAWSLAVTVRTPSAPLALPAILGNTRHLGPETVGVVGPVTNVTEEVAVLVTGLATVLTGLALLTLPAASDPLGDLDVVPAVEIVLPTGGAVQQVAQLAGGQLRHLPYLPLVA